ncbi:MAG: myristoyl transferase, partial [Methyloprofundus sp.]|nr:myristoyl transferase [Methyloprofundus sp.]
LNAILGFSQLLESDTETPLTEEQKENVDYIISGGRHLLALINQVLELSAIEARQVQLNIETIDIQKVVDEVLPLINTLADKTNIQIHVLPDKSYSIKADDTALKQIIINLMSNAIKYNKPEGCVCLTWQQVSEQRIKISITDKGLGISEENQKKVFSAFNRLGQEHSGIEGTGIGLVVTKNLVEMMQGEIGFSSTLGVGSTFWIELPLES